MNIGRQSREISAFDDLISLVQNCSLCERMNGCTRVLSHANGPDRAPLMFIGEAPGRLGADRTAVPFHGDKSGDNFEQLLSTAGLSRRQIFVTNAVLCNPRDNDGNNVAPSRNEMQNCAHNLRMQIDFVQPKIVLTLGKTALDSLRLIEYHDLVLSSAVRTMSSWYGRQLIPLYHPGARAMMHRSRLLQQSDYYFVAEKLRRLDNPSKRMPEKVRGGAPSWNIVRYIISQLGHVSLFRLHKILYLVQYYSIQESGSGVLDFYFIRQKDGPYCVELGGGWHRAETSLKLQSKGGSLWLNWLQPGLFESGITHIEEATLAVVDRVLQQIKDQSDEQVKRKVYLSKPMRQILRDELNGSNGLNRPLFPENRR